MTIALLLQTSIKDVVVTDHTIQALWNNSFVSERFVGAFQNVEWTVSVPMNAAGYKGTLTLRLVEDYNLGQKAAHIWTKDFIVDFDDPSQQDFSSLYVSDETDLLAKFAPIVEFAQNEQYLPITINKILNLADNYILNFNNMKMEDMLGYIGDNVSKLVFNGQASYNPYPITLYGKAHKMPSGDIVLSYYMFYSYDSKGSAEAYFFASHDGDRESISITLKKNSHGEYIPEYAIFGHHLPEQT